MAGAPSTVRVLVWDRSMRVFHWALVVCVAALLVTGLTGAVRWHIRLGEVTLGLVLFRLIWGWMGSQTARFASFVVGPLRAIGHLRHRKPTRLGHNPLGGWMVLAMLAALSMQTLSGLLATGDGLHEGPLARWIGSSASATAFELHEALALVLIGLVLLHMGAVLIHRVVLKDKLIRPMIDGHRPAPATVIPPRMAGTRRALLAWAVAATAVFALMSYV